MALAAPPQRIQYTVTVADTTKKLFRVSLTAEGITDSTLNVAIPAWSPGWYVLTNADKNIANVAALNEEKQMLPVMHPDRHAWRVETGGAKTVTVTYDLTAKDQDPEAVGPGSGGQKDYGFFAPYLDESNGFVPGPASLMYVVDGKMAPCQVTYKVPEGWKIASANDPVAGDPTTFTAPNYDVLVDQPGELGHFTRYDRTLRGTPISVILVGAGDKNAEAFVNACWRIVEAGFRVYGTVPFPRYIFHFRFLAKSPGMEGLEHLNSTVISLPLSTLDPPDISALSIVAHEYTHAWNVKRIRPAVLGPFDYTQEVRIKDLWWLEGVTDYYAPRLLVEAGLTTDAYWRAYISDILTSVQNNPARKTVTLDTASLKAWEGRSEGFGGLSYYEKGLVVGLLLDVEMRKRTNNEVGLDDLLKALYQEVEDSGKGYPDGEIERLASKLTHSDLSAFFKKALSTTDELDYDSILSGSGMQIERKNVTLPDVGLDDKSLTFVEGGLRVGHVTESGPAEKAGLKDGDVITSIDGKSVDDLTGSVLGNKEPGDTLRVSVRRDDHTLSFMITLGSTDTVLYSLVPQKDVSGSEAAIYRSITGSK
jgi:predicted metalloprotease with PDZ domain